MSDDQIRRFLRGRGVADHVVDAGLDGLVGAWERVVATVEGGYPLGIDDYLNDLDIRQIIEVVVSTMPTSDGPLIDRLRAADARMRAATVPAPRCVWGDPAASLSDRRNWWYFVIPPNPGEELADGLARQGFSGPPSGKSP